MWAVVLALSLIAQPEAEAQAPERLEFGLLPAFGLDVSTGVGLGMMVSVAKLEPGHEPYAWYARASANLSILDGPRGVDVPRHWHQVYLEVPGLWQNRLRLYGLLAFLRQVGMGYFGPGNGSKADPDPTRANGRYHQYGWLRPSLDVGARLLLCRLGPGKLELLGYFSGSYNEITVYPGSELAEDIAGARGAARQRYIVGVNVALMQSPAVRSVQYTGVSST
jgi:hypothetical protein